MTPDPSGAARDPQTLTELLAEVRGALQRATPGRWKTVKITAEESELGAAHTGEPLEHLDLYAPRAPVTVNLSKPGVFVGTADFSDDSQGVNVACLVDASSVDAALIAKGPEWLGALVQAVEDQQRAVEKYQQETWRLIDVAQKLERSVSAWIGTEAPRMDTSGPRHREMEIARAHLRTELARLTNAVEA